MYGMYAVITDNPNGASPYTIHVWQRFRLGDEQARLTAREAVANFMRQHNRNGNYRSVLFKGVEFNP